LRARHQPCIQRLTVCQRSSEAVALLSFPTSRVSEHRTREKSPSLLPPLPSFSFRPREMSETGISGMSFRRPGVSPLSEGANPSGLSGRRPLLFLEDVNPLRPIFSARPLPDPREPGTGSLSNRFRPACRGAAQRFGPTQSSGFPRHRITIVPIPSSSQVPFLSSGFPPSERLTAS
jgi:hypothetical protein